MHQQNWRVLLAGAGLTGKGWRNQGRIFAPDLKKASSCTSKHDLTRHSTIRYDDDAGDGDGDGDGGGLLFCSHFLKRENSFSSIADIASCESLN